MARAVRFLKESQTEFSKLFSKLCNTHSSWQVWADFVLMSATVISNALDQDSSTHEARERQYLQTIKQYKETEQKVFPELFALMIEALEANPEQDFLGEIFMGLNLGNHWKGQFFTPYNVCKMMAEITVTDLEARVEKMGLVSMTRVAVRERC